MWLLYVAPLVLLVLGLAGFALGILPLGIIMIVLAALVAGVGLVGRARSLRLNAVDGATGIPGDRQSSYEPRSDPGRTPTGGSTGTP